MPKNTPVWFNQAVKDEHQDLRDRKLVSQPFNEFVKSAVHEKIDSINQKEGDKDANN